ncbi:hypothetical protein ABEF93_004102 [Exophiala dermatitidis]
MQHSRPPHLPSFCSSFKKHRFSIDNSRFTLDLSLPKPIAAPAWASLPTPPMSGSPPPEPPVEPPQIAGRRRKRSHTPPVSNTTTGETAVTSPATPLEQTASRFGVHARGGETLTEAPVQPGPFALSYPHPGSYQSPSSLPTSSVGGQESRYVLSSVSPRSARKAKAHVASACINCKKKHLRCDNSRPCRRCVASGKEDSCVDVEHKKRGRPPLKPEDPSARRGFETTMSSIGGPLADPMRRMPGSDVFQTAGGQRGFRPLQAYDPSRGPPLRGPPFHSMYAPPSISPSPATALGTFVPSSRQYPSVPAPIPGSGQAPLPGHGPQPPDPALRPIASYSGGYSYPPPQGQMGPPSHMPFANPIFPRPPERGTAYLRESLPPLQGQASLQLPPIRPSAAAPIDPAITQPPGATAQPPLRAERGGREEGTHDEPDPKRPKMDIQGILGPRHD